MGKNGLVPTDGPQRAGSRQAALIGRAAEQSRLGELADLAAEEGAQVVILSGEAGIGKSSLIAGLLDQLAANGWGTHVGHCIEYADRPLPFGPIVSILRSLLLDNLEAVDDLVGHHRDDLASLLPELGSPGQGASLAGDVDRLFDAISSTLVQAAERRPVAVLVEDIHWADAATRDLLASLVHSLGSAPILLVITERSGALPRSHPLRTWLAEQRRFPNVASFELVGLTLDELAEQARRILGHTPDGARLERLLDRTRGNPYFTHEILTSGSWESEALPSSLVEFLTSRIERLSDDERAVLRAVAVAGGTVSHRLLAAMLPELRVGGIVRALFDASILVVEGTDYAFGHALLREAILGDVLPFEAEELHRRAAEAIEADPQRGSSLSDLVGLALHLGKAADPDRSLAAASEAAEAAAAVAAYETAAEMAKQALTEWSLAGDPEARTGKERDQLLLDAAEWLVSCYRGGEAVDMIDEALATWGRDLPDGRRALLMARMAPIHFHLGNPTEATALLWEAQRLVGDEVSPEAAQVHHRVSKQAVAEGQIHPTLEAAERAIEIAETQGPRMVLVEALTTKALGVGVTEDLEEGVRLAREARELALADGFVSQVANTYRTEMLIWTFRDGRTENCLEAARQGLDYAQKHCGPRWRAEFRHDLCLGLVEAGRLSEATPLFAELWESRLDDLRRLTVLQTAGLHALGVGRLDLAEVFLADATEISDRYQTAQETGFQAKLLAELARRQGRLEEAVELIDEALKLQLASDNLTYTRDTIVEKIRIVRALAALGTPDGDELYDEVATLVEDFDGAGRANLAMKAVMELELTTVHGGVDIDAARDVIAQVEGAGFLYESAQARLHIVDQLLSAGADRRDELQREITELVELATTHGMEWMAERATALARLGRVGLGGQPSPEPPTQPAASLPHDLTVREVEVMSLLAQGLTNKAIGEALYVSPRTVGTHVSNLLAKLGLHNRGEAAAAYHRLGLEEIIDLRDSIAADTGD